MLISNNTKLVLIFKKIDQTMRVIVEKMAPFSRQGVVLKQI